MATTYKFFYPLQTDGEEVRLEVEAEVSIDISDEAAPCRFFEIVGVSLWGASLKMHMIPREIMKDIVEQARVKAPQIEVEEWATVLY